MPDFSAGHFSPQTFWMKDSQLKEQNKVECTAGVFAQEENTQHVQIWLKVLILPPCCDVPLQKTRTYREKHTGKHFITIHLRDITMEETEV